MTKCNKNESMQIIPPLMAQINEVVSAHLVVSGTESDTDGKKFDISKIDFDRLRREFARGKNTNLLFRDMQQLVEERLQKMLVTNPLRIDYYERYQAICDDFNRGKQKR